MPRDILAQLSVLRQLRKQAQLLTVKEVINGYNYRLNELKCSKGVTPNLPTSLIYC